MHKPTSTIPARVFMNRSVVITTAALIGIVFGAAARAQTIQLPKEVRQVAPQIGELLSPKVTLTLPAVMNARGDAATAWMSKVLTRNDSRISGEIYTIGGTQVHSFFGFTVINPDPTSTIDVLLSCYRKNGAQHSSYTASLRPPRFGVASWDSSAVTPERSSDHVTGDQDLVWCLLRSDRPFVAFGTRTVIFDDRSEWHDVILVPIAR